jgi:uncharacterized membrane protein
VHAWTAHGAPLIAAFLAALLGSLVECVEALTVVLAVASVRGWRGALAGTGLGLATLLLVLAVGGRWLAAVPMAALQLIIGALLLLFGLRWLRKAILRAAGLLPLHDEARAFQRAEQQLRAAAPNRGRLDPLALATSFKIVLLEGGEVVFIVLAVSPGTGTRGPAVAGALAALVLTCALGIALRRPLARVPENSLKFAVGILLSAFGSFWVGAGLGLAWPGEDWSLLELIAVYGFAAAGSATLGRRFRPPAAPSERRTAFAAKSRRNILTAVSSKILGYFVDDGPFAAGILAWILISWPAIEWLETRFQNPAAVWILPAGLVGWLALHSQRRYG